MTQVTHSMELYGAFSTKMTAHIYKIAATTKDSCEVSTKMMPRQKECSRESETYSSKEQTALQISIRRKVIDREIKGCGQLEKVSGWWACWNFVRRQRAFLALSESGFGKSLCWLLAPQDSWRFRPRRFSTPCQQTFI